jgi:hypothetical protein
MPVHPAEENATGSTYHTFLSSFRGTKVGCSMLA